jgi:Bacteriophage probable baseplate hub protein
MADDPSGLKTSRPTVRVGGRDAESVTGGLLSARVREDVHGLSNCELEVGNWGPADGESSGFLFFDRSVLDFGKELEFGVADGTLFRGKITAIEARFPEGAPPTVVVLAEDRFQDLRMTRRTRAFADISDAGVVAQIAGDHGLTPDVGVSGPSHRVLAQLNQSDLAFLRERARALDAELWVSDSTLKVQPRSARASAPLTLTYGKELREFRVLADLAHQRTSVEVTGWDVAGKRAIEERADDAVLGGELKGGDSGPSVLRSAFGERKDGFANTVPHTGDEARARAEALLKRRARRFVAGHGVADAMPGLRVGATVKLGGLGPLFEGDFYVSAVTHLFDGAAGLRSELAVERPALGRAR